jgi:hypothetical protein
MIDTLKEHINNSKGPVDISLWISNALLDITTTLTINRDHGGIGNNNELHPALATLNDTMAFLWTFLQFQRLPRVINWSIQKVISAVLGHFKFFERNNLSRQLMEDRLRDECAQPDYCKALWFLKPRISI